MLDKSQKKNSDFSNSDTYVTLKDIAHRAGVSEGTVSRVLNNVEGVRPETRDRVQKLAREMKYRPREKEKTTTLKDVAEEAGVSVVTVSRVLNHNEDVRPDTRDKVFKATETLGYRTRDSRGARSQKWIGKNGKNPRFHLIRGAMNNLPPNAMVAFRDLIDGLENAAHRLGCHMTIHNVPQDPGALFSPEAVLPKDVDGVIVDCALPRFDQHIRLKKIPCILTQSLPLEVAREHTFIATDNFHGARLAIDYLLDLGHQRVAILRAKPVGYYSVERHWGYLATLGERGIGIRPEFIREMSDDCYSLNPEEVRSHLDGLFQLDEPPTALFDADGYMGPTIVKYCADRGIRIPEDVSLACFIDSGDDIMPFDQITVVRPDMRLRGELAVQELISMLGSENYRPRKIIAPADLLTRPSTAPPRND